jgi:sigma-B regulation protein RsbU (phosphoserine phosphatase)
MSGAHPDADAAAASILAHALFRDVPPARTAELLARCRTRALAAGETLLAAGQPNDTLYLLLDGELRVHLDAAGSATSFGVPPGECVGDVSLIDGAPASAFVIAAVPSRVLAIDGDVFWSQLMAEPAIARNLLRLVVRRLRERAESILASQRQQLRFEALQRELDAARSIQASMLPGLTPLRAAFPHLDLHASMEPAREVGGDFYDALAIDERDVLLTVGDVSGKGMPAALFMVRTLTVLRLAALRGDPAAGLLGRVNDLLCENNPSDMFTTAFVALLDTGSGLLTYYNGGHPAPLLSRGGGPFAPLPLPRAPVVGIMPGVDYAAWTVQLQPGDRLVAYTDGVTEAEDPDGAMLGDARLAAALDACAACDAAGLVQAVRAEVDRFAAGAAQSDDITLLALAYRA